MINYLKSKNNILPKSIMLLSILSFSNIAYAGEIFSDVYLFVAALVQGAIPSMLILSVAMFLFGIFRLLFLIKTDKKEKKQDVKKVIFYAIITFVMMILIYLLVGFLSEKLNINI
jgi:hypothetical protein